MVFTSWRWYSGRFQLLSQCKHYKQPYRFTVGVLIVSCQLSPALYIFSSLRNTPFLQPQWQTCTALPAGVLPFPSCTTAPGTHTANLSSSRAIISKARKRKRWNTAQDISTARSCGVHVRVLYGNVTVMWQSCDSHVTVMKCVCVCLNMINT